VAITVDELIAVPFVKMRCHAGRGGGDRLVTWAHTSDLPNATDWLTPGDLLMANGLSLPSAAEDQVSFLSKLASADLSGFVIGDDRQTPALTAPFLERAEELRFPVLGIPHDVSFAAVSRVVANANSNEEHARLVRTVQLYEILRGGVSTGRLGAPLLAELGRKLGCRLLVVDTGTALPVLPGTDELPEGLRAQLLEELHDRGGVFPGMLRMRQGDVAAFAVQVPGARPTALVALRDQERLPDLALLQHAANIAALGVERVYAARAQDLRLGRELFVQMLDRSVDPSSALRQLREHGMSPEEIVVVGFRPPAPEDDEALHHALAQRQVAHLVLWDRQCALAAVPNSATGLEAVRGALGPDVALGVSDPLGRPDRAPDAAREARWANTAARALSREVVRYGEGTPLFLPRTLGEAATAAERVLGPVVSYDADHATELVHSLAVFLAHNRSWQRAAEALHVHKQTLVYRMHRVEELTGRDLRETADVVELWLALQARELAHGELTAS
jgi:purine catabolism regulator